MMLDDLIDLVGDRNALALGGALIGVLFGALAQRSRFCLRAATLEVAHGEVGERLAIWLFVFATALIATQALILLGLFDTGTVRQLNNRGSLSGSIIGGLMFGCGMTLTRACASRMLVLSATGNLRALLSGMVFAVVAQMTRDGALSPRSVSDQRLVDHRQFVTRHDRHVPHGPLGRASVRRRLAGARRGHSPATEIAALRPG